ncbi:hypothetical protein WJ968_37285 [Achromobacter xylosoxidans]
MGLSFGICILELLGILSRNANGFFAGVPLVENFFTFAIEIRDFEIGFSVVAPAPPRALTIWAMVKPFFSMSAFTSSTTLLNCSA